MTHPLNVDDVARVLDKYPLSLPGATFIALLSYFPLFRSTTPLPQTLNSFLTHVRTHRWLTYLLLFVFTKSINRALVRLVRNHGWKADKPIWKDVRGEGDVVLITGGSAGIGKEVVEILAKKTSLIANLDMAPPTYSCKNVKYYKCDVTDPKNIAEVANQVRKELGQPTIIINNAGIARGKTILETTPDEYLLTYKVNVIGCLNILREFLPYIISINHGHIMTTASSASYMTIPQLSEYSSSKTAVLSLHEALNEELVHRYNAPRVRTSVICPTKVATDMGNAMKEGDQQFMMPTLTPQWLAKRMVAIIDSGLSDHLVAPGLAAILLPKVRSMPEWFRWGVHRLGKTEQTITNAGNEAQNKIYKIVSELDKKHGISSPASASASA
ncbi:NAD(P)-binding protein [Meredithblackwellia eburnea MCA 4105]